MKKGYIGIFDSGYGGLTVMKEIASILPQYDYIYLGDNARTPYGNHGKETVTRFTDEAVQFLFKENARLIIIACYTASALALRGLQEKYLRNSSSSFHDRKILGVIRPVAEEAAKLNKSGKIGVTGTRATIQSKSFETELLHQNPNLRITTQECPLLVPLIEEHWHKKPPALMILKKYLRPLKDHNIDTLLLGCTHYPLMITDFKRIMGKRVKVLDGGKIAAKSLVDYLKRHSEIETQLSSGGSRKFYTTDDAKKFCEFGKSFAGINMKPGDVIPIRLSPGVCL